MCSTVRHLALAIAVSMLMPAIPVTHAQCDTSWETAVGDPGLNSTVWSLVTVNRSSGIGPAVYAGGQFSFAGGNPAKNVARWDGVAWSPLGTGAENGGIVYALVVSDDDLLYAGGAFGNMGGLTGTKRIAKWDGTSWSDVGGGMSENNTGIRALTFFNGDLYAGGYLNEIGGITAHKIALWNGSVWSALPGDPLGSTDLIRALGTFDDDCGEGLYVGGYFQAAGSNPDANYIFRWDGASLEPLGQGANNDVEAFTVWDGALYVAGQFNRVYQSDGTEVVANKVARWDGTSWHALGDGMNSDASYHVWALATFDDGAGETLYAGGNFSTAGGVPIRFIARWDRSNWSEVGAADLNGQVYDLAVSSYDGGLYTGGTFTTSGDPSANRLVRWGGPLPHSPTNAEVAPSTIHAGESADLSASVPGATINWYTGGCGETLVGSGDLIMVSPVETTTYHARAFDGVCWSYDCDAVTVTVLCVPPTITSQPVGGTACAAHSHELCVVAEGSGELRYQWKRNGLSLLGATSPCHLAAEAGTYSCVVTDDCGPTDSVTAVVTLASPGLGDFDGDGNVNLDDYALLENGLHGPSNGIADGCECIDVDGDGHVDLFDFAVFQGLFTESRKAGIGVVVR
ncbi:MAG: hypothetical protein KAV82_00515 [Phycisphaerae bacterium]|nr:hypothetical protein [Phycisphaerae bacterium]